MIERVDFDADLAAIKTIYRGLEDGRPVHEGSDTHTQSTLLAALSQDVRKVLDYVDAQIFPDTADTAHLERHAALYTGTYRLPATGATGTAIFEGNVGASIPAETSLTDEQDQEYQTSAAATVGAGGTIEVDCEAVSTGTSTRLTAGAALTLTSPPTGVSGAATVETSWTGGSDKETDAELLARHLFALRHPIAGGNKFDYITWALSVPGVYEAYHFPRRRGLGTADTVILINSATRLPSEALIDEVQDYIDDHRPAGLYSVLVYAPDPVEVDVEAEIELADGYDLAEVTTRIETDLESDFAQLAPGDDMPISRLQTIISLVEGVSDRVLVSPAANVEATVDNANIELLALGTVTISEM